MHPTLASFLLCPVRRACLPMSSPPAGTTISQFRRKNSRHPSKSLFSLSFLPQQQQHNNGIRNLNTMAASSTTPTSPDLPSDRRPIVIAGPSGVGKGTLYKALFAKHPGAFALSISHTTRSPRPGEQHGVDYYYVSKDEFKDLIAQDKFVENAQFGSNFYGTSKATIAEQSARGAVVVLDIEMEGVKQVKRSDISARYVFVAPPSDAELERRLRGRGTESEDSIRQRLARAQDELAFGRQPGAFDRVIVNDDLDAAVKALDDWVYGAPAPASAAS